MPRRTDLSLALAGLNPEAMGLGDVSGPYRAEDRGRTVRAMIEWAGRAGFRAVQIDARVPGVRARDLDRSGRRDLAATIRRADLICSGLDLWIPPEHFSDSRQADRAAAATLGAIELAADLAALSSGSIVTSAAPRSGALGVVSLVLPGDALEDVVSAIVEKARERQVRIADHAWPVRTRSEEWDDVIGVGLDPAAILLGNDDPSSVASRLGSRVFSARLSDLSRAVAGAEVVGGAGVRVAAGSRQGRLDVLAYLVALTTSGYHRPLIADLRGVADQAEGADQLLSACGGS
ncbi:MAG: sugar phosphate isomerase/epimerase family protein [Phycisphaerales bacterium]